MRIALIDPFFDTSHKIWAEGLRKYSRHTIDIYSDSPHNWKWKMTGGAISSARKLNSTGQEYELILVTDMIHLSVFKSLLRYKYLNTPIVLYFHENQITYPWSPDDQDIINERDHHYGFVNYTSALAADRIFYNSNYHLESFNSGLSCFLKMFPNHAAPTNCKLIKDKSQVLPLGLDLPEYHPSKIDKPVFIWNHRWEYDKQPELFFNTLFKLKDLGYSFSLIVSGRSYKSSPAIFKKAKEVLKEEIIHFGFVKHADEYKRLLEIANIMLATSIQDFFGISVVEAIAAGCYPVLPDRLAFPEHVPESHEECYQTNDQIIPMLIQIIEVKKYLRTRVYSDFVQKYHWNNLIDFYDLTFEGMIR